MLRLKVAFTDALFAIFVLSVFDRWALRGAVAAFERIVADAAVLFACRMVAVLRRIPTF